MYKLGQKAKDKVTGITGVLTSVCQELFCQDEYCLSPQKVDENGYRVLGPIVCVERIEFEHTAEVQDEFKYELGKKVRDRVSGMTGIILRRRKYIYGKHDYYEILPEKFDKNGMKTNTQSFNEDRIELID
jgi:heat shock protein HspQ